MLGIREVEGRTECWRYIRPVSYTHLDVYKRQESVGSMVVYEKGRPKKSDYRKFRIKSVQGPNDYASMEEVLTRRFTHESTGEFDSFARMPDLLLMDGGRGQVNICLLYTSPYSGRAAECRL